MVFLIALFLRWVTNDNNFFDLFAESLHLEVNEGERLLHIHAPMFCSNAETIYLVPFDSFAQKRTSELSIKNF